MKKNKALLDETEHALHQHNMFATLAGRFVGPTRPLVPMIAGMLDLPVAKFIVSSIIGCVLWPSSYFLPGVSAGAAINIPSDMQNGGLKWLLLVTAVLLWAGKWSCRRLWHSDKVAVDRLTAYSPHSCLLYLVPLTLGIGVVVPVALLCYPLVPVYIDILHKVVGYWRYLCRTAVLPYPAYKMCDLQAGQGAHAVIRQRIML